VVCTRDKTRGEVRFLPTVLLSLVASLKIGNTMKLNISRPLPKIFTHEGARASNINPEQQLRRSVMACMLWENTFYESGEDIAARIAGLVSKVPAERVAQIAIEARTSMKLRHVPLLLVVEMAKLKTHRHLVAPTAEAVIQRADELAEILAVYTKGRSGVKKLNKLSKQLQKGIAAAFHKFNEYSLAKYNQDNEIKLRDVLFAVHPKPKTLDEHQLWARLVNNTLATPDTWEVGISAAKGNPDATKLEWTRLLTEKKLGALALLRNLRNMSQAGVDRQLIRTALATVDTERVLPFRFVAAARFNPEFEPELEQMMLKSVAEFPTLAGRTAIVVDNSGSMSDKVSAKSDMSRQDAASALAILVREVCDDTVVIGYGSTPALVPPRRGFALRDAIQRGPGGGTDTGSAIRLAQAHGYDRIIVITDEQSHTSISTPGAGKIGYFINVAPYKNGIGYGPWLHIDGWSEAVLQYILAVENE
jgi:60 kDa SS-A/Ro ribonucleoprotein